MSESRFAGVLNFKKCLASINIIDQCRSSLYSSVQTLNWWNVASKQPNNNEEKSTSLLGDSPNESLWPKEKINKPHRPRSFSHKDLLSTSQAFWHCMTLVLGLGTLTMPYVLKQLGWGGLIALGVLAWLSAYTAKLLCVCIDFVPSSDAGRGTVIKILNTYPDIGEAAFGQKGKAFVGFILYVDLIASSALFLVFIAMNMSDLFPGVFAPSTWILICALTLLPTVWLRLQKLTFLSAAGSYIMVILVFAVLYAAISAAPDSLQDNHYDFVRFEMQAFGNMIFAFACHGTLLTIYRDMKTPAEAPRLFNQVYLSGYLIKVLVGCTGYYLLGQNTSDQITLDLPIVWLKTIITLAVTAKKWLTYALPLEPVAVAIESSKYDGERSLMTRTSLVLLTVIMAIFLPYFGLFQSLIGSLCAGFLVLIFPIGFYLKLYGRRLSTRERISNYFLLMISIALVGVASFKCLEEAAELWTLSSVGEENVL